MTPTPQPSAERLAALLKTIFVSLKESHLLIISEETVKAHPGLAALIERVITADRSLPGRQDALEELANSLYMLMSYSENPTFPEGYDLSDLRRRSRTWWRTVEITDLVRAWALPNAALELGVDAQYLTGVNQSNYCARLHEHHFVPMLTGTNFREGWSDEFYSDAYWRGLATLSVIGEWFDTEESYEFTKWAGQQENIKAIAEEGRIRDTINIEVLSEAIGLGTVGPALSRGML